MTKREKAELVDQTLANLYPAPAIPLDHKDAYTLLIAVLLSAQCTDVRVNTVTPALFRLADNPADMITHTKEEVREIIRPCGLSPTKSANIITLSHQLLSGFEGRVPDNLDALKSLAGVGHKTASVVMAQMFGVPSFPVDTHIHRLMWRWGLSSGKNVTQTEKDARRLFPKDRWNALHLQIIYYGRERSPARGVKWERDILLQRIGRVSEMKKWQS